MLDDLREDDPALCLLHLGLVEFALPNETGSAEDVRESTFTDPKPGNLGEFLGVTRVGLSRDEALPTPAFLAECLCNRERVCNISWGTRRVAPSHSRQRAGRYPANSRGRVCDSWRSHFSPSAHY